jgi:hypothetical protein
MRWNDPLEALCEVLEALRTRRSHQMSTVDVSDEFRGFEDNYMRCLALLMGDKEISAEKLARFKGGCTGECIDGIVSPSMVKVLNNHSDNVINNLAMEFQLMVAIPDFPNTFGRFLPPRTEAVLKTNILAREGLQKVAGDFGKALDQKILPTDRNVRRQVTGLKGKAYSHAGGRVSAVAQMVFQDAMDDAEIARERFLLEDGAAFEEMEEIQDLPKWE